jgi:predicted nucleic acid-binding protein
MSAAYFDTSALIKLVFSEAGSDFTLQLWIASEPRVSCRLSYVEGCAALAAAHRTGRLTPTQYGLVRSEFLQLFGDLLIIEVTRQIVEEAGSIAERRGLRGYDAVHVAAALRADVVVVVTGVSDEVGAATAEGLRAFDVGR